MNYFDLDNKKRIDGFSLIELVVVLGVLAILSAVAIPNFICFQRKAKATAALTSAINIQKECEISGSLNGEDISSFQPVNLSGYKALNSSSSEKVPCGNSSITLEPDTNNANLLPTFIYSLTSKELTFSFKGITGKNFNTCLGLICSNNSSQIASNRANVLASIEQNSDVVIDGSYSERGCSAYVLVKGPSWKEAEENANKLNGHLATVKDVEENKFIESIANNEKLGLLWIGLKVNEDSGKWEWSSGEESSDSSFDNFSRSIGQGDAGGDENFGAIVTRFNPHYEKWNYTSGGWHDSPNLNPIVKDAKGIVEIPLCKTQ